MQAADKAQAKDREVGGRQVGWIDLILSSHIVVIFGIAVVRRAAKAAVWVLAAEDPRSELSDVRGRQAVDANAKNIERGENKETKENAGGISAGILSREERLKTPLPIADVAVFVELRPLHRRGLVVVG